MQEELDGVVADLISSIEATTRREYLFVKGEDWSVIDNNADRVKRHDLHWLLTSKAIDNAKKLYSTAKADIKHPRIKDLLGVLLNVFEIYSKRGSKYLEDKDWTKENVLNANFEISFQNTVSNNLFDGKKNLKGINLSSEDNVFDPQLYNKQVAPLLMQQAFEERYPQVKEITEAKLKQVSKKK